MGILSNFFGTSSAASKQPSSPQGPPAAAGQRSQGNVWRSVFDPGSNPNISKVGSEYYDNVKVHMRFVRDYVRVFTWSVGLAGTSYNKTAFGNQI